MSGWARPPLPRLHFCMTLPKSSGRKRSSYTYYTRLQIYSPPRSGERAWLLQTSRACSSVYSFIAYRAGGIYNIHIPDSLTSVPEAMPRRKSEGKYPIVTSSFHQSTPLEVVGQRVTGPRPQEVKQKLLSTEPRHRRRRIHRRCRGRYYQRYIRNGGDELCAVLGNIETLLFCFFCWCYVLFDLRILLIQHLTLSKYTRR